MYVQIILGSVKIAEWPSFWRELLTQLPVYSLSEAQYFLRISFICNSLPFFWFREQDFGYGFTSFWYLPTFNFYFPFKLTRKISDIRRVQL